MPQVARGHLRTLQSPGGWAEAGILLSEAEGVCGRTRGRGAMGANGWDGVRNGSVDHGSGV